MTMVHATQNDRVNVSDSRGRKTTGHAELRVCVDRTVEAIALNDRQAKVIFDPSPEVDSLAERIVVLRHYGVPESVVRDLLGDIKRLLELNSQERSEQHAVAGSLDRMLARDPDDRGAFSFKDIARRLREDLAVLDGDPDARGRIAQLVSCVHPDRLTSSTLRHEIGGRKHDLLRSLIAEVL